MFASEISLHSTLETNVWRTVTRDERKTKVYKNDTRSRQFTTKHNTSNSSDLIVLGHYYAIFNLQIHSYAISILVHQFQLFTFKTNVV